MQLEVPENFVARSMDANSLGWLFVGTNDGLYRSTENGFNLSKIGLENVVLGLIVDLQDNIFAGSGPIYLSTDNGEHWSEIYTPSDVNVIYVKESLILYGSGCGIYKSTDFGETWSQVLKFDIDGTLVNALIENNDEVIFAGITSFFGGGGVYRSLDGGDTWEYTGLLNHYISALATNSQGILFAGSIGDEGVGIYCSDDNGETWTGLKKNVFVTSIVVTPEDVIYIGCSSEHGTQGGVFRSVDNGNTWEHLATGMGDYPDVEGLTLAPDGYLYAYSRWSLHRSTEPVFDPNVAPLQEANDLAIFPNPFIDFLHFQFPNGKYYAEDYSVKVFYPIGRLVFVKNLGGQQRGTINLSSLPQGLYYISVEINGQRYAKPILKVLR